MECTRKCTGKLPTYRKSSYKCLRETGYNITCKSLTDRPTTNLAHVARLAQKFGAF